VYDHYRDRWIEPRRWVRYDGSPGDLLLSVTLAVPLLTALDGVHRVVVVASVTVGVLYATVRRVLPDLAELLVASLLPVLPGHIATRVPDRYLQSRSR